MHNQFVCSFVTWTVPTHCHFACSLVWVRVLVGLIHVANMRQTLDLAVRLTRDPNQSSKNVLMKGVIWFNVLAQVDLVQCTSSQAMGKIPFI